MTAPLPQDPRWPQVGQSLGPWLILRHHDLEGSGDMFLARRKDGAFEREVLITLQHPTPPGEGDRPEFLAERELQGQLDHPGIAKVLGAGRTPDGLPYLVTEYLDGPDIEIHSDQVQAPIEARLRSFQEVCAAIHHAHEKGIRGLNLQASNVHLMPDGSMRIVVFGLAQWNQTPGQEFPRPGLQDGPIVAGDYASPEQWRAQEPSERSDVYALGVLLYRLLTGFNPQDLRGLTPAESRAKVEQGNIQKASAKVRSQATQAHADCRSAGSAKQLASQVAGDLDRILVMALATDPGKRYASALELSEDLDRHLMGHPIRARGPAPMYVLGRTLARYRIPIALFLSVALTLGWALNRSFASSRNATAALLEAQSAEAETKALGSRLRDLCVRFMTELGPNMQGRPGLEDARRYLLNVSAPLLDHLRGSGHEDTKLALYACRSYSELAEADYVSRDISKRSRTPDSSRKALSLTKDYLAQAPVPKRLEASYFYIRSVRSAIWFAALMLDSEGAQSIIDEIPQNLSTAELEENELTVLTKLFLGEARRTFYASEWQYGKALDAWDLESIRSEVENVPSLLPFFEADYSRFASVRAGDLIRAGREQEALYKLPTLVYQMSAEVSAHDPPVLSLLGNEASAWINLATVRIHEGMPPGEALVQGARHLDTIRKRFTREPGAKLVLVSTELGLGSCKLQMGQEQQEEALQHLNRAASTLQQILDQGSRWPLFLTKKARIQYLRAQALFHLDRNEQASKAITLGLQTILSLPESVRQHSRVLLLHCSLRIEQIRQQGTTLSIDWAPIERDLEVLRQRKISTPELIRMDSEIVQLRALQATDNYQGANSK